MSSSDAVYVVGEVILAYKVPKKIKKDDKETLLECPGYPDSYSLSFAAKNSAEYMIQSLPLSSKFFQGSAAGQHTNGIVTVTFQGCFKVPISNDSAGDALRLAIKEQDPPFLMEVLWLNNLCQLCDQSGNETNSLLTQAVVQAKPPTGVKFRK
jgi:hypothetical protein